jgi:hypothetical protein
MITSAASRCPAPLNLIPRLFKAARTIVVRADRVLDRHDRAHGSGTAAPGFDASLLVHVTSTVP